MKKIFIIALLTLTACMDQVIQSKAVDYELRIECEQVWLGDSYYFEYELTKDIYLSNKDSTEKFYNTHSRIIVDEYEKVITEFYNGELLYHATRDTSYFNDQLMKMTTSCRFLYPDNSKEHFDNVKRWINDSLLYVRDRI
jgi:hypothetical protein